VLHHNAHNQEQAGGDDKAGDPGRQPDPFSGTRALIRQRLDEILQLGWQAWPG
jgi:hypothetical protein